MHYPFGPRELLFFLDFLVVLFDWALRQDGCRDLVAYRNVATIHVIIWAGIPTVEVVWHFFVWENSTRATCVRALLVTLLALSVISLLLWCLHHLWLLLQRLRACISRLHARLGSGITEVIISFSPLSSAPGAWPGSFSWPAALDGWLSPPPSPKVPRQAPGFLHHPSPSPPPPPPAWSERPSPPLSLSPGPAPVTNRIRRAPAPAPATTAGPRSFLKNTRQSHTPAPSVRFAAKPTYQGWPDSTGKDELTRSWDTVVTPVVPMMSLSKPVLVGAAVSSPPASPAVSVATPVVVVTDDNEMLDAAAMPGAWSGLVSPTPAPIVSSWVPETPANANTVASFAPAASTAVAPVAVVDDVVDDTMTDAPTKTSPALKGWGPVHHGVVALTPVSAQALAVDPELVAPIMDSEMTDVSHVPAAPLPVVPDVAAAAAAVMASPPVLSAPSLPAPPFASSPTPVPENPLFSLFGPKEREPSIFYHTTSILGKSKRAETDDGEEMRWDERPRVVKVANLQQDKKFSAVAARPPIPVPAGENPNMYPDVQRKPLRTAPTAVAALQIIRGWMRLNKAFINDLASAPNPDKAYIDKHAAGIRVIKYRFAHFNFMMSEQALRTMNKSTQLPYAIRELHSRVRAEYGPGLSGPKPLHEMRAAMERLLDVHGEVKQVVSAISDLIRAIELENPPWLQGTQSR